MVEVVLTPRGILLPTTSQRKLSSLSRTWLGRGAVLLPGTWTELVLVVLTNPGLGGLERPYWAKVSCAAWLPPTLDINRDFVTYDSTAPQTSFPLCLHLLVFAPVSCSPPVTLLLECTLPLHNPSASPPACFHHPVDTVAQKYQRNTPRSS